MDFGRERSKWAASLWILVLGTKKKKQIEIKRKNTLVTNIRHFIIQTLEKTGTDFKLREQRAGTGWIYVTDSRLERKGNEGRVFEILILKHVQNCEKEFQVHLFYLFCIFVGFRYLIFFSMILMFSMFRITFPFVDFFSRQMREHKKRCFRQNYYY